MDEPVSKVVQGGEQFWVTPGLTPLTGPIAWWLRITRAATVAFYDFSGLLRFRARLHPAAWMPIWLAWDRGAAPLVLPDVLRAFAGGRMASFAFRSLVWHPHGPPWIVAVPLLAWTVLLAGLVLADKADILAHSRATLSAWLVFDILLAWLLFKVTRKPRRGRLAAVGLVAMFDAILSVGHLASSGLGAGIVAAVCRTIATAGPVIGTAALFWAACLPRAYTTARRR